MEEQLVEFPGREMHKFPSPITICATTDRPRAAVDRLAHERARKPTCKASPPAEVEISCAHRALVALTPEIQRVVHDHPMLEQFPIIRIAASESFGNGIQARALR